MGADITLLNPSSESGEPTADLLVRHSALHGTVIEGAVIPTLIDELPMIAAMACFADRGNCDQRRGRAEGKGIQPDCRNDRQPKGYGSRCGGDGGRHDHPRRKAASRRCHRQPPRIHRIAMTFAVTALASSGETEILDADCINISYPSFYEDLKRLQA